MTERQFYFWVMLTPLIGFVSALLIGWLMGWPIGDQR